MLECTEGNSLWVPGGAESVRLAWYGDARRLWCADEAIGRECTLEVKALLCHKNTILASNAGLTDPCPRVRKKLCIVVTLAQAEELFCPGKVVWMYRNDGTLQAAEVPCDLASLRRVYCDKRMVVDHGKLSYQSALLFVRAQRSAPKELRWQPFSEAGETCPCCHSVYDWMSTARSKKQRWLSMTNCRNCGLVVCISCASTRRAIQGLGIFDPARICDRCAWQGPPASAALAALPQAFS